jgi:hypothetical protein
MKNLIFILSILPFGLQAQVYVPLISTPDSTDTWVDVHSCTDFDCWFAYRDRYTVVGNITAGGVEYAKFHVSSEYEQGADQSEWCTESISYTNRFIGIREANKKIYVNQDPTSEASEEYLVYDFNLTVGDTVPSPGGPNYPESNIVIQSIDSVLISGLFRKRYRLDPVHYIVEGVGSSTGLLNPIDFDWSGSCQISLECYQEDDVADFFMSDCELVLSEARIPEADQTRELLKIVDSMGRETTEAPNTLLFFIYSNGEIEKVFQTE